MKLKSKLIATIVSICAAIAVMGVGVWAATSNFTVSVTNTVTLGVTNLTGTVDVKATATGTELKAEPAKPSYEATLFNSETSGQAATASITETEFTGVKLLTTEYINAETTEAEVEYVFTYRPITGAPGAGTNKVTITTSDIPAAHSLVTFSCTTKIGTDEAQSQNLVKGTPIVIDSIDTSKEIVVTLTATYSNPQLISISLSGSWIFSVVFDNVAPTV